ncbi:A disintegrin and metallo ase with thrombospondin motifs 5-like [Brachionus plicatilis]|uniref:A disintegrin and metallo ase with thrombospondin motifs 5-like n=1 Tax=Brachionus plicatilis TaxID=10195 RepID=A0A3M7S9D7_BRAPC|nr:A disintegrin and metallo ase with thrombospondin motifs 5-like [Brachionus plicatilis]
MLKKGAKPGEMVNGIDIDFSDDGLIPPHKSRKITTSQKRKRAVNGNPLNMEVETLLVVDPTVYEDHKAFLQTTDDTAIFDHIRTYYAHTFNGVDDKYQRSLENDPDLRLRIRLIHVLIITNPLESTWTDVNIVGETGNEFYNGKEVILSRLTLNELQRFVDRQGLTFEFDHVIGVFNKDLWSDDRTAFPSARSPVIGVAWLNSICSDGYKYSLSISISLSNSSSSFSL